MIRREDDFIPGFAALGASHPSSPTRRGGAKQIEAQRPAGLWGFSHARPYRSGASDCLARKKAQRKALSFNLFAEREVFEPITLTTYATMSYIPKFQIGNETVTIFRRWACPTLTAVCLPNFRVQR